MTEKDVLPYFQPTLWMRLIASGSILAVFCVILLFFFLTMPIKTFCMFIVSLTTYMVPGFGKEGVVPFAMAFGIEWWQITVGIVVGDMVLAIIIVYNFGLLLRIPLIGRLLRYFMEKTNQVLQKYLWIRELSLIGLFLFMYIPFMGSSAIITTIVGRLLSVAPRTLLMIVFVGSVLATLTMAVGTHYVISLWKMNPWYAVLAIFAIFALAGVCWKLWQWYAEHRFGSGR